MDKYDDPFALTPFQIVLEDIELMHDRKQADYGREHDPFANVRSSEDFGIDGWVGALVRANDKMKRLQKAASGGELTNEGVEDSLLDLATYACIALVLWREERAAALLEAELAKYQVATEAYEDGLRMGLSDYEAREEGWPTDGCSAGHVECTTGGGFTPDWVFHPSTPSYAIFTSHDVPPGTAYFLNPQNTVFARDGLVIDDHLIRALLGQ